MPQTKHIFCCDQLLGVARGGGSGDGVACVEANWCAGGTCGHGVAVAVAVGWRVFFGGRAGVLGPRVAEARRW